MSVSERVLMKLLTAVTAAIIRTHTLHSPHLLHTAAQIKKKSEGIGKHCTIAEKQ